MPVIKNYEKYLGLPSFVGREKKACFNHIKERIWANVRMEGEIVVLSRQGNNDQSGGTINPNVLYECLSASNWSS